MLVSGPLTPQPSAPRPLSVLLHQKPLAQHTDTLSCSGVFISGDEPLESLPQPWQQAQGHLKGTLMYQVLEGLDSWGMWAQVGTSPEPCRHLAFWGGRAWRPEDQSSALYSVQPRMGLLSPWSKGRTGSLILGMNGTPERAPGHLIAVDRDVGAPAPGRHRL